MRHSGILGILILTAAATASAQDPPLYTAAKPASVRSSPQLSPDSTAELAQVRKGATVQVIGREREWVRVRVEGWIRESDLVVADSALRPLSTADLRSDPAGSQGKLVRWQVEAVALRTADALRTGLNTGEPYLLALGPAPERALVYLAVPPSLLPVTRNLAPMAEVVVTARVRNGRSEPAGVPVLELQSLTKR
ncbi:MAG TPA: SH3 domain-containing protein [Gemmatimonadaceae bacterium]